MQVLLTDEQLPDYLRGRGIFEPGEAIRVEPAGDGNINWVRRASSEHPEGGSWVVKQARPALERFPQYHAPTERVLQEAAWIRVASALDPQGICPEIRDLDQANRVLVLEDLGASERLDRALARGWDVGAAMATLAGLLARVHWTTAGDTRLAASFGDDGMRRLHGDHIFRLPYEETFPLPPETAEAACRLREERALVATARSAHARYLQPRGALVHGDVQSSNILVTQPAAGAGVKLLDAEIAHIGDPAFDLGTLLAHLVLPAVARDEGERVRRLLADTCDAYSEAGGSAELAPAVRYAGLELLRRTVGAARVPAVESDAAGLRVAGLGRAWALAPTPPGDLPLRAPLGG